MLMQLMVTPEQEELIQQLKRLKPNNLAGRVEQNRLVNDFLTSQEFPSLIGRPVFKFKPTGAQKNELAYIARVFGGVFSSEYIKRKAEMEQAFQKYAAAQRAYIFECRAVKAAWIEHVETAVQKLMKRDQSASKQELISEALNIGLEVLLKRAQDKKSLDAQAAKHKDRLKEIKDTLAAVKPPQFPEAPKNPGDVAMTLEELQRKYVQKKKFS